MQLPPGVPGQQLSVTVGACALLERLVGRNFRAGRTCFGRSCQATGVRNFRAGRTCFGHSCEATGVRGCKASLHHALHTVSVPTHVDEGSSCLTHSFDLSGCRSNRMKGWRSQQPLLYWLWVDAVYHHHKLTLAKFGGTKTISSFGVGSAVLHFAIAFEPPLATPLVGCGAELLA